MDLKKCNDCKVEDYCFNMYRKRFDVWYCEPCNEKRKWR